MQKNSGLFILIGVVSFACLAAFRPALLGNNKTAVASAPSAQISINSVSSEGRVVPLFFTELSFQLGGTVSELLVEEGDVVEAGDPLVRLEATDFEINLQQALARLTSAQSGVTAAQNQLALAQAGVTSAQSNIAAAEANLALTLAGPTSVEIAEAEARIAAAEAAVTQAVGNQSASLNGITNSQIQTAQANLASVTADLRALENQYQEILDACFTTPQGEEVCPLYGPVEENTRAQLEIAQANQEAAEAALDALLAGPTAGQRGLAGSGVALAEAQLALAEAQLALLLAGPTPEQIRIAEVGVDQAEVGVQLAEAAVQQAEAAVTQAEANVTTANATVDAAQAALDRMTIFATIDGTVSRVNTSVGQLVAAAVPVVTLADFSEWRVETIDLTELDIARVQVGDSVTVTFDALPGETITGEVLDVSLVAALSRGDVVYETLIRLDDVDTLPIRWGMTVFADMDVSR